MDTQDFSPDHVGDNEPGHFIFGGAGSLWPLDYQDLGKPGSGAERKCDAVDVHMDSDLGIYEQYCDCAGSNGRNPIAGVVLVGVGACECCTVDLLGAKDRRGWSDSGHHCVFYPDPCGPADMEGVPGAA